MKRNHCHIHRNFKRNEEHRTNQLNELKRQILTREIHFVIDDKTLPV